MIKSGVTPVKKDHRDYSFHRTFGGVTPNFANSLDLDAGLTMPDQETDGLGYGCTGYAQSELCVDEDKIIYYPKFTYDQTLMMEGITPSDPNFEKIGCDVRDSLNSTIVYGLQAVGETGSQALNHRRGAYYNVDLAQGMDSVQILSAIASSSTSDLSRSLRRGIRRGRPPIKESSKPRTSMTQRSRAGIIGRSVDGRRSTALSTS